MNSKSDRVVTGITGHRKLAQASLVRSRLLDAYRLIEKLYPGRKIHCLTALAEGADRLAALALPEDSSYTFSAVLPMPQSEYEKDFGTDASKAEFRQLLDQAIDVITLSPPQDFNDRYLQVGEYILNHCQILVAVWDLQPARGAGGTGDIVNIASRSATPTVIIALKDGNPEPPKHYPQGYSAAAHPAT